MGSLNNIEHDYLKLLKDILSNGVEKDDRTGTGTLSVFGRQIRHSMSEGFPLLTTKKLPFKTIVTELLWFLQGRTDLRYLLENNCHIWTGDAYKVYDKDFDAEHPPFSAPYPLRLTVKEFEEKIMTDNDFNKMYGDLGSIYGKQWRNWNSSEAEFEGLAGIDQIQNLICDLKTNPDSRRLMVNAWNVGEIDQMTLPPCHYGFQVYTKELTIAERIKWVMENTDVELENLAITERAFHESTPQRSISLMWNQRSVDTFLGLPFNIASYALLLEIIAKATNMVPDELIGNLGDTHLYLDHIDQAKEQLTREPMPLSKLNINTEFWPTEGGECGEGLLDAVAVFNGFNDDNFCKCLLESDIQLGEYQSHPAIKAPLSN
jgi:thymidylate synthase